MRSPRSRGRLIAGAALAAVLGAGAATRAQEQPRPQTPAPKAPAVPPFIDPRSGGAVVPEVEEALRALRPRSPEVVCGTTLVPADPAVDRGFLREVPDGTFTLRTVPPGVCGSPGAALRLDGQRMDELKRRALEALDEEIGRRRRNR